MGRCQLLQMLAVLSAVTSLANVDRANATEQRVAQADPSSAVQVQQSKKQDDVPPGGCTPIGLTASGEMVFPLLCRALLEQQRGPISEELPAAPPKPDAPITASKQESTTTSSKQDAPVAAPKQELATTPPNPDPPPTTLAISRPDVAPQIGPTGRPVTRRNSRRKQLAGERAVGNIPTGSEVTGSVRR
jgi:hypothetical protein